MSLKDCRLRVLDGLLNLVWSQWTGLGVAGSGAAAEKWILDPEALVLFTCTIGRFEPRVFDSMLEWIQVNQRFLNVQRMRTLAKREEFASEDVLAPIAKTLLSPGTRAKWARLGEKVREEIACHEPLFRFKDGSPHPRMGIEDPAFVAAGIQRPVFKSRDIIRPFDPSLKSNLILKLRALFGVSSRCEILAYLLTRSEANPSEIASATGFYAKTIYNALSEMNLSGEVIRRDKGRESLYSLRPDSGVFRLCPGCDTVKWMDWPRAFRALEILWAALDNPLLENENTQVAASELKLALIMVTPRLQQANPHLASFMQPSHELARASFEELCELVQQVIRHLQ